MGGSEQHNMVRLKIQQSLDDELKINCGRAGIEKKAKLKNFVTEIKTENSTKLYTIFQN